MAENNPTTEHPKDETSEQEQQENLNQRQIPATETKEQEPVSTSALTETIPSQPVLSPQQTTTTTEPNLPQVLQNPLAKAEAEGQIDKNKDSILELYKLEYTTAVKRHDDIYKSMWTNFSYMAILAGGILTFGKESLSIEFLIIIACLPLTFWFCGSYLPLDKYGRLAANRASKIEDLINEICSEDFKKYRNEANRDKQDAGLSLYQDFEGRNDKTQNIVKAKHKNRIEKFVNWLEHKSSVRASVGVSFGLLLIVIIIAFICWAKGGFQPYKIRKTETTETKLESINNTLGNMSNSISGLRNSYEIYSQKEKETINAQNPAKATETNTANSNSNK